MTMPSKGRRKIIVNGILYHYKVNPWTTVVENTESRVTITVPKEYKESIQPRYVEEMIVENKL